MHHPRTMQEYRYSAAILTDEEIREYNLSPRRVGRGGRSKKRAGKPYLLPNSYDDKPRSNWGITNWKHHRRTKWRQ